MDTHVTINIVFITFSSAIRLSFQYRLFIIFVRILYNFYLIQFVQLNYHGILNNSNLLEINFLYYIYL